MCFVPISHLLFGLKDIAAENIALSIPGDVTKDLQILGIMGNVENPEKKKNLIRNNHEGGFGNGTYHYFYYSRDKNKDKKWDKNKHH